MSEEVSKKSWLRSPLNYEWILDHLVFLLFLAFIAVLYIANGHWADNTVRDINVTAKQVKDLEYEYKNLKSIEMYKSRESEVAKTATVMGLKPSTQPPLRLNATKDDDENKSTIQQ